MGFDEFFWFNLKNKIACDESHFVASNGKKQKKVYIKNNRSLPVLATKQFVHDIFTLGVGSPPTYTPHNRYNMSNSQ